MVLEKSLKIAAIPQSFSQNGSAGRFLRFPQRAGLCRLFLWRAGAQSGFSDSIGRMQCDHKPMMQRNWLDLISIWECRAGAYHNPIYGSGLLTVNYSIR